MALYFITGGCRSGKSLYAQNLAESLSMERTYLATCPHLDEEMTSRILRHQKDRKDRNWQTIEEETNMVRAIASVDRGVILIDCLTLWVNNIMYHDSECTEDLFISKSKGIVEASKNFNGDVVVVSNEVGFGIVPELKSVRAYRDYIGRVNQMIAQGADEVILMVSGIAVKIKEKN